MDESAQKFNVGGVTMPRPFKIRRFAHFGFNLRNLAAGVDFYTRLLGFRVTDVHDFSNVPRFKNSLADCPDTRLYFTNHGSDHHSLLLMHPRAYAATYGEGKPDYVTTNQITWQVGTLDEVVKGHEFLRQHGVKIERVGREPFGTHWYVYMEDPDGHTVELLYGISQIGWDRLSKPREVQSYINEYPASPEMPEEYEIEQLRKQGVNLFNGNLVRDPFPPRYDVGGVMLPRPFKVTKIGPLSLYVNDLARAEDFYCGLLGFIRCEEVRFKGRRCAFLRHGNDHHSMALFPIELRAEIGTSTHSSVMSFGAEVGSYQQLREARDFLRQQGVRMLDLPPELHPGIDYALHALDPDGHCVQLYYYMEQIGWDGEPRPQELRRKASAEWPETLDAMSDSYVDQTLQGPLG